MISDIDEFIIVAEGMTQAVGMISNWSAARRRNWGCREGVEEDKLVEETKRAVVDIEENPESVVLIPLKD